MQKPSLLKLPPLRTSLLIGTALLLLILEFLGAFPNLTTPVERVDLAVRDSFMRLRGLQPPGEQIVIVAIDDASFNVTGYQWPWPRDYLAQIVNRLDDAGARIIGLDVLLFESGYDAGGDEALAAALARAPRAVSVMQIFSDTTQGTVTLKLPLPIYRDVLDGLGITDINGDDDAIVRSLPAYVFSKYDGQYYYNWAFQVTRLYLGVDPPANPSPTGLTFHGETVPLSGGQLLINYNGPGGTYPTYSAAKVADGMVDPAVFRDKIVLIGATTQTLHDNYPIPLSASKPMPGVEIVANTIHTLLTGNYIRIMPPWVALLLTVVMAAVAGLINRSPRPSLTVVILGGAMLIFLVVGYVLFVHAGWYLPVTGPELMLFLGVVLPTLEQAISQELEKRRVRSLFTRFISPKMVDQLLATQDINSLNKRARLTILFSDIRGFTTMSERLTPEDVVSLLNPYLEAMTTVIHKHGGTVDKYEGDAIVAFFGEPVPYADHAMRAARTAVEMLTVLAGLSAKWQAEGRLPGRFEVGIGINTGEVFVGLLGSAQRISYTVIGDNVNLAARLQDMTKVYGWPIIVSEGTAEVIRDEFDVEFVEAAVIKGKRELVKIYKLLGRKGTPESERVKALKT